jgi:hypothetical protein
MSFISYLGNIKKLPAKFESKILSALNSIGLDTITISSTYRSPESQALAMYQNVLAQGLDSQRKLYGQAGNKVLDTFQLKKNYGYGQSDIIKSMTDTINQVGQKSVSAHLTTNPESGVAFDVIPSSIPANKKVLFENAMKRITSKFLVPGSTIGENVYHGEMKAIGLNPVITLGILALAGYTTYYYLTHKKETDSWIRKTILRKN